MHNNKTLTHILLQFVALCCLLVPEAGMAAAYLIVHPQQQAEDLSTTNLVRIYAMQRRVWSDGTPIRVFTLPKTHPTHRQFVNQYLHMQPYQLDRVWHRLVFSGTGVMPDEVRNVADMLSRVAATPGAVGYIDQTYVDQIEEGTLKVVAND